jgi:hypothetical protein
VSVSNLRLTRPAYPDAVIAKEISVTSRCQKITGPLIQELFSLIGKENVFAEEPDRLGYASDEMPNSRRQVLLSSPATQNQYQGCWLMPMKKISL